MRVAFVSPFVIQGGAERYLALLLDGLDRSWIARIFFSRTARSSTTCAAAAIRWRSCRPLPARSRSSAPRCGYGGSSASSGPTSSTPTESRARWWRPSPPPGPGFRGGLKCDFSRDGWLARTVARRCRSIAAVSKAVTETFGDDALAKTTVVPFGLPEAAVDRAAGRAALDEAIGAGGPVIGLFGRLDPHKGHREVLEILPELRGRVPGVRAAFFGADDPAHPGYREELAAEIAGGGRRTPPRCRATTRTPSS